MSTTDPVHAPSAARDERVPAEPRRVHVKTYGCQMNVYDSDRITEALAPHGYVAVAEAESADVVVLNTCHIREKAAEKVYSEIGRLRKLKQARELEGGTFEIAVAGCVAQAEGAEILARAPAVGVVVGPQSYHRLPRMLSALRETGRPQLDTEFPEEDKFDRLPPRALPRDGGSPPAVAPVADTPPRLQRGPAPFP